MMNVDDLSSAVESGDVKAAMTLALEAVKSVPEKSDLADRSDLIDVVFDVGDWLFEIGSTADAATLYAEAFRALKEIGETDVFALARQLDRLARHHAEAGEFGSARGAIRKALDLTQSEEEIDPAALEWRYRLLSTIETRLRNESDAEAALEKAEELRRKGRSRELDANQLNRSRTPFPDEMPASDSEREQTPDRTAGQVAEVKDSADYTVERIYFATHRKPKKDVDGTILYPYDLYGYERSDELNFGVAEITVPRRRVVGQYSEPEFLLRGNRGAPDRTFTVLSIEMPMTESGILMNLDDDIVAKPKRELLVFVHGFNCSLTSGLMRTAQLKVDMDIDGAALLYSFPSKGSWSLRAFSHDVHEASRSEAARQFSNFLTKIHSGTGARKIHIVAHSLGCEVLLRALDHLADKDGTSVHCRFDEIIFAAPAVPRANFQEMVKKSCNLWHRATFYTSDRDIPLRLLSWWEQYERAGIDPRSLVDIPNVNGIDTTADRSWLGSLFNNWGHNDFTDTAIDDLRAIAWLSLKPAGRRERIEAKPTSEKPEYWAVIPRTRAQLAVFIQSLLLARKNGLANAATLIQREISNAEALPREGLPLPRDIDSKKAILAEIVHFSKTQLPPRGIGGV